MKIAIILVRGLVGVTHEVKETLHMLRLTRKNNCVVLEDSPVLQGMIRKAKDYITWGEIQDETFSELVKVRGEEFQARVEDRKKKYTYTTLDVAGKKYKPYFRLNPPRKGFGRKGIKVPFKVGGALGNRAEAMNDLIMRML